MWYNICTYCYMNLRSRRTYIFKFENRLPFSFVSSRLMLSERQCTVLYVREVSARMMFRGNLVTVHRVRTDG
jgi:hypothetical protein